MTVPDHIPQWVRTPAGLGYVIRGPAGWSVGSGDVTTGWTCPVQHTEGSGEQTLEARSTAGVKN